MSFCFAMAIILTAAMSWQHGVLVLIASALVGAGLLSAFLIERFGYPFLEAVVRWTRRSLQQWDLRLTHSMRGKISVLGPDLPLILLFGAAFTSGMLLFLRLLEGVVNGDPLVAIDRAAFDGLQLLRSPSADAVLIVVTELGDRAMLTAIVIVTSLHFTVLRRWRAMMFLVFSALGSSVFISGIKLALHRPRPMQLYDGISEFSFPSGHATSSLVIYGFVAILLAHSAPQTFRRALIAVTVALVLTIAFSRLYLGAHWLSDVGAGLAFGTAWVAVLSILYFRLEQQPLPSTQLISVLAATMIVAGTWHVSRTFADDLERYGNHLEVRNDTPQDQ